MSGLYWSLTFLDLCNSMDKLNKEEIVEFLKKNQHESGGFGPCDGHDPHILYTLSALQIILIYDVTNEINKEKLIEFICGLQQKDGSFAGDAWGIFKSFNLGNSSSVFIFLILTGEVDTRFSFCAVAALSLLVSQTLIFVSLF